MTPTEVQAVLPVSGWRTGRAVSLQRLDGSAARNIYLLHLRRSKKPLSVFEKLTEAALVHVRRELDL